MHEFVRQPRLVGYGDGGDSEDEDYEVFLFWPSSGEHSLYSEEFDRADDSEGFLESPITTSSCPSASYDSRLSLTSSLEHVPMLDEYHSDARDLAIDRVESPMQPPLFHGLPALDLDLQELPDLSPLPSPRYSYDSNFAFPANAPSEADIMDVGYSNVFCFGLLATPADVGKRFARLRAAFQNCVCAVKRLFARRASSPLAV